jgi:hypothetical protein
MNTTKLTLGLAGAALLVSAAAPAAVDISGTNPNPLHPAFYANKLDSGPGWPQKPRRGWR